MKRITWLLFQSGRGIWLWSRRNGDSGLRRESWRVVCFGFGSWEG